MNGLTPDITSAEVVRHGVLRLTFADGLSGEVDVLDRLRGPVFEDARTPAPPPSGDPRWWADRGEGVRQMTMMKVPSVQAASVIFKGH